jgi:hypothetical protein
VNEQIEPKKKPIPKLPASFWGRLRMRLFPTYEDLVALRDWYRYATWNWDYPDGMPVPQNDRMKLFAKISRLNRKIEKHPKNPAKREMPVETPEPKEAGSDA